MYFDNFTFQSDTLKQLINDIIEHNIYNDIVNFDVGNLYVIFNKNDNFKEKILPEKIIDLINVKGQELLDLEFQEIKENKLHEIDLINQYWSMVYK